MFVFDRAKYFEKQKPFTTQTLEFGLWTVTRESHLLSISFVRLTQTVHISQWQHLQKETYLLMKDLFDVMNMIYHIEARDYDIIS